MPSAGSLLDAVRAAYARIGDVEIVARDHPGDQMVLASLQSLRAHAEHLAWIIHRIAWGGWQGRHKPLVLCMIWLLRPDQSKPREFAPP